MVQFICLLVRLVSPLGLTYAVSVALVACDVKAPAPRNTAMIAGLRVLCEPADLVLQCRAMERASDDRSDPTRESDLTQTVAWSTSNARIANVVRGRVTGHAPGTVTIVASVRSGDETLSASVVVIVDDQSARPTLAFDVKGVVRDLSNTGITNVELTLVDDQGRARTLVTRESARPSDGSFQFVPVLGGQYRLRARKAGYRPVERLVNVPDAAPLTLVLLAEPL